MSPIIPTLALLILTVSLCPSHGNLLPQPTPTCKVHRRTNHNEPVENCSNEIQHPNINITSSEGIILTTVNSTYTLFKTHNPEGTLTCYSDYPIEWVFTEMLSSEGIDIRERREAVIIYNEYNWGKQIKHQLFVSDFSFSRNSSVQNATCRAATGSKQCKQTTVKFHKTEYGGIEATSVQVLPGFPQGKLEQYFNPEDGNNINCLIQLVNNPESEQFVCNSLALKDGEENSWQLEDCYNPECYRDGYGRKAGERCEQKPIEKEFHATFSPLGSLSGIVSYKPSSVSGIESRPELSTSAASHYFRPVPDVCNRHQFNSIRCPKIYVDWDPLSLTETERVFFMSFCGRPTKALYAGEIIEFSCMTSLYVFAEGVRMTVKYNHGFIDVTDVTMVNGDNRKQIQNDGYRTYTTKVTLSEHFVYIVCAAPLRNNIAWQDELISFGVSPSINLTMEGNVTETVEVEEGEDLYLECKATGVPEPEYKWTYPAKPNKKIPSRWININHVDGNSTLRIPAQNVTDENIVSCTARNRVSRASKMFTLKVTSTAEVLSAAEVPWVAILIPMVLIAVGCLVGFLVWKIIRIKRKLVFLSQAELDEFMEGRPDVLLNSKSNSQDDVNSYAMCLPYNKNYEVLKEQLEIDFNAVLGSGAYGMVLKGILTNKAGDERVAVAIKTMKPMDDISYFKALMSELKIMGFIGEHRNIINLLGAYTRNLQNREIFIAIELCENGCMLNYMRNHRSTFISHDANGTLQTVTLMKWSMQIANGMDFLYQKRVIHGDLAARNILLSENLTAKIGDFGLSRQLYEYVNYIKKHQSPLPWKWLAIECLQDMNFSSQSDVWAYGITLWEVFSLGHSPYPGCTYNEEFIDSLVGGKRPSLPQYATEEVYDVMTKCWNNNPSARPSFSEITIFFDNAIRSVTFEDYLELECTSEKNSHLPVKMDGQE